MPSRATTVKEYLAALPPERREALEAVRAVVLANLDGDYREGMQYGMIGYYVPHAVFPAGYHCDPKQPLPFASLAAQKNHLALYLFGIYLDPKEAAWLESAWRASGKKLDMGKSCIRFKKLADVPLEVVGEAIRRMPARTFIAAYCAARGGAAEPRARKASPAEHGASKGKAAKPSAARKAGAAKAPARRASAPEDGAQSGAKSEPAGAKASRGRAKASAAPAKKAGAAKAPPKGASASKAPPRNAGAQGAHAAKPRAARRRAKPAR